MKKIKLIALFAALIVGLGLYQFLKEIGKPVEIPHTDVVVAAVDIPENTQITPEMVMLKPVVTEALLPGSITELDAVTGMAAAGDVFAGEQITGNRLAKMGESTSDSSTLAYTVKPGMRAVTVAVNIVSGLENFLKPGNHVDLMINTYYNMYAPDGLDEEKAISISTFLMDDIEILAVGPVLAKEGTTEYATVTLHVTPEQALKINFVDGRVGNEIYTTIRLALRSPLDNEPLGEMMVTIDDILGETISKEYPQTTW